MEAQFVMPRCCSRCLAEEPSESFTVHARMQVMYPDEYVYRVKKYQADVPLCKKCKGVFRRRRYLFWILGLVLAVMFVFSVQVESDVPEGTQALSRFFLAGVMAWVIQWGCKQLFNFVAAYDPASCRWEFANKKYQAMFDEANRFMPDFAKRASRLGV